jgi:Tol biopolymer transport system component
MYLKKNKNKRLQWPLGLLIVLLWGHLAKAQQGTEVYLFEMQESAQGIALAAAHNLSQRPGYDNQPSFDPKGEKIFFVSMVAANSDVWEYDLRSQTKKQRTFTPDSEYSPVTIPDGRDALACIVLRKDDGAQDLIRFEGPDFTQTSYICRSKETGKIGYQAWLNAQELIVFVLGEPATLHYLNRQTGQDTVLARQVGRSLQVVPGQQAWSFVEKVGEKWVIKKYNPQLREITDLAVSPDEQGHFHTWTPNGTLLLSQGNSVLYWHQASQAWRPVSWPMGFVANKCSRLAVHGKYLAVVMDE